MIKIVSIILFTTLTWFSQTKTQDVIFENSPNQLRRIWMLVEFKDYKKEYLVEKQASLDLTKYKHASANLGCIAQSFIYSIKKNHLITFKPEIKINMKCQEMDLDIAFAKSISDNFVYEIKGQKLILTNSKKEKIVFVAQDWD